MNYPADVSTAFGLALNVVLLEIQIETVMYQKLTPMLLNEGQKLNAALTEERERIKQLEGLVLQILDKHEK